MMPIAKMPVLKASRIKKTWLHKKAGGFDDLRLLLYY
jgi:hypothetical protein